MTSSSDNGYYALWNMPPGQYRGMVSGGQFRAMYLTTSIRDAAGRFVIVLTEGEGPHKLNVALPRALSLTVRVVDERGEPLSRIGVNVRSLDTGRDVWNAHQRRTDDHGRLRVFALQAGRYLVCAEDNPLGFSTEKRVARRDRWIRTCYPDVSDDAKAEPVTLDQADTEEIEIRMRRGRMMTVSGIVLNASGAPEPGPFGLMLSRSFLGGVSAQSISVGPDGRFRIVNMAPGDYAIVASVGGPSRPEQRRDLEVAYLPLHIDSTDIEDVIVRMSSATRVSGTFIFEGLTGPLPDVPGGGLMVVARLTGDVVPGEGGTTQATADKAGRFTFERMFGRRILDVANVPRGWFVRSIRHGDTDVTASSSDFTGSANRIEVILSRRGASIAGTVVDDAGRAVAGARIIVFATDHTRWTVHYPPSVLSAASGAFQIGPLRGGEYFVVALQAGSAQPDPRDRERFALLADIAERITLDDEEPRRMDLRVVRPK